MSDRVKQLIQQMEELIERSEALKEEQDSVAQEYKVLKAELEKVWKAEKQTKSYGPTTSALRQRN